MQRLEYPVGWLQTFAILNIARFIDGQANATQSNAWRERWLISFNSVSYFDNLLITKDWTPNGNLILFKADLLNQDVIHVYEPDGFDFELKSESWE